MKEKELNLMLKIADIIIEQYPISFSDLFTKNRSRKFVEPRQIIHFFCHKYVNIRLQDIGFNIGRKDHCTVLHSVKTIDNLCNSDIRFKRHIDYLENKVKNINFNIEYYEKVDKNFRKSRQLIAMRKASIRHNIIYKLQTI